MPLDIQNFVSIIGAIPTLSKAAGKLITLLQQHPDKTMTMEELMALMLLMNMNEHLEMAEGLQEMQRVLRRHGEAIATLLSRSGNGGARI